jgi:hypothetical protein
MRRTRREIQTHIVAIDVNPGVAIWIERLPRKLPKRYTAGRNVRQYRLTPRRVETLYSALERCGGNWSYDSNGHHWRREGFTLTMKRI